MTEPKKQGLGIFISKKDKAASPSAPVSGTSGGKPKDVQRRWLYVGLAAVGVMVTASTLLGPSSKAPLVAPGKQVVPLLNVTPKGVDKASFEVEVGKDLASLKDKVSKMETERAQKDSEIKALRESAQKPNNSMLPPGIVAPPTLNNTGGLSPVGTAAPPAPPVPINMPLPDMQKVSNKGANAAPELLLPPSSVSGAPVVFDAPSIATPNAHPSSSVATSGGNVAAKSTTKKNEGFGLLPAGAFAPMSLLNGLDAGTSSATQSNPMPVLMNVTEQATLPGAARYKIKNCFALGTGYGDLSAERVYIRFSRMSCVDKNDKLILSQDVAGYVVDSDGKLGMRGKVMDRQGAKLGAAMLAGFAQGLSGALGGSQGTSSSSPLGGITNTLTGSGALRASGLAGAQSATAQLAEFYLKEAQAIFPVIAVDTGRTGTLVFTSSVSLNWTHGDAPFVQELKPN
ncbi:MAG: TrbI/VirB10 family protein [Agitococcus sp.]|nr:TrbI/VirB10 family protein [Agitococcus sp.]MDO9176996.1 TrbI/VirB10 family protein [Agitococcus sp.]